MQASSFNLSQRPAYQDYGSEPLKVRETDQYRVEYVKSFVEKWDELVGWDLRTQTEGNFFIDILREHGAKRVLDVSTGTGFHSIRLLQAGFDVVSADGSAEMLAKAFQNGCQYGLILRTVQADWRCLGRDIHEKFDAVICLGNSFTHLFEESDRRKALAEFYSVLNYDGILILDQRNYDSILEQGFSSKHIYYYCGDNVKAEPEHIDDGLARFRYEFPDRSVYHLNMFPLRKDYTRRLMKEVGFVSTRTYGDFQETYHHEEQDFFIHVANKLTEADQQKRRDLMNSGSTVKIAKDYYNSQSADAFYAHVWGGEDIHIGVYDRPGISITEASRNTVEKIASLLNISPEHRVLDIGAGYGGAARYLAKEFGCSVTCLNLSDAQNERNKALTQEQGLDNKIKIISGNFEDIPEEDESFDIIWSQDAILHSGNRVRVFREVERVLKPGGEFIFTDPMQYDDCLPGELQAVLDRIHLDSMGSLGFYRKAAESMGLDEVQVVDLSKQLINHYSAVLEALNQNYDSLKELSGEDYLERMKVGLNHWIDAGKSNKLVWGILHFRKHFHHHA
ncbi:MAG: methyltransferase domain-containing protein [Leptolyngbyaceae cyanobacterium]